MTRRRFLELAAAGVGVLAGSFLVARSQAHVIYRKIKARLRPAPSPVPENLREVATLTPDGERVSVELALNSRCNSDSDGDPETFHWGMLDPAARLSAEQVARIVNLAHRCHLSEAGNRIEVENNTLTFVVDATADTFQQQTLMIGSGLQQQAVCLACAALGIGLTFDAQGPDGTERPGHGWTTVKMRLGAMKPSYRGSFWSAAIPEKERPWLPGNLPTPQRDGQSPLVKALQTTQYSGATGTDTSLAALSQLLWAARGRTPHLYKSKPWGLTIPTWQGMQDISSVHVLGPSTLHKYVNWKSGRPTHALEVVSPSPSVADLRKENAPSNVFIVLSTNEPYARSLWEVGYQLLNIAVQASSLGVAFQTIVLNKQNQAAFSGALPGMPVAMVGIESADIHLLTKLVSLTPSTVVFTKL